MVSANGRIALGSRLAIIDTGPHGAQPMSDALGRWTITFNSDIERLYSTYRSAGTPAALGLDHWTGRTLNMQLEVTRWDRGGKN